MTGYKAMVRKATRYDGSTSDPMTTGGARNVLRWFNDRARTLVMSC